MKRNLNQKLINIVEYYNLADANFLLSDKAINRKNTSYTLSGTKSEKLNKREREIIILRKLREKPLKLEELSKKYNISRERVRQIEEKAFEKLQKHVSIITQ